MDDFVTYHNKRTLNGINDISECNCKIIYDYIVDVEKENKRLLKALHTSTSLLDDEIQSGGYEKITNDEC